MNIMNIMPISNEVRGARLFWPATSTDGYMPMLAINYNNILIAGEDVNVQHGAATYAIDADGGSSAPTIVISIARKDASGTALTALTYTLTGGAANDLSWTGSSPTYTATALNVKGIIDLLNKCAGITCWAMHAPHDASINSTSFIDQGVAGSTVTVYPCDSSGAIGAAIAASTSAIPIATGTKFSQMLYRDVSAYQHTVASGNASEVAWLRLGIPELRDNFHLLVHRLYGQATFATSNGMIRVYSDRYDEYGQGEIELKRMALTSATDTALVDLDITKPESWRGSIILELYGTTAATDVTAVDMLLSYCQGIQ